MILYHYTSASNLEEIKRTGVLKSTGPWTVMDAAFGHGWYLTDLNPQTCDAWTMAHCWRTLDVFEKVESYLKFEISDTVYTKCGRDHVYMITLGRWDGSIYANPFVKYLEGGKTPKCTTAVSCLICDVFFRVKKWLGLS